MNVVVVVVVVSQIQPTRNRHALNITDHHSVINHQPVASLAFQPTCFAPPLLSGNLIFGTEFQAMHP